MNNKTILLFFLLYLSSAQPMEQQLFKTTNNNTIQIAIGNFNIEIPKEYLKNSVTLTNLIQDLGSNFPDLLPINDSIVTKELWDITISKALEKGTLYKIGTQNKNLTNLVEIITNLVEIINAADYLEMSHLLEQAIQETVSFINNNLQDIDKDFSKFNELTKIKNKSISNTIADALVSNPQNRSLITTLEKHTDRVKSIALSKNEKTLFLYLDNNTIKLWNISDPQNVNFISTLNGHPYEIKLTILSKDEKTLFSYSDDNTIKLWNLKPFESANIFQAILIKFALDYKTINLNKDSKLHNIYTTLPQGLKKNLLKMVQPGK